MTCCKYICINLCFVLTLLLRLHILIPLLYVLFLGTYCGTKELRIFYNYYFKTKEKHTYDGDESVHLWSLSSYAYIYRRPSNRCNKIRFTTFLGVVGEVCVCMYLCISIYTYIYIYFFIISFVRGSIAEIKGARHCFFLIKVQAARISQPSIYLSIYCNTEIHCSQGVHFV